MSSPISYLLAALLLPFFFINFHGSKANFSASTNCPIHSCGNGLKFHYPFWKIGDNTADQYCAYPGFGLKCSESGEPILTLPNDDSFIVKDINFNSSTISPVDLDVVDQNRPRVTHSMSVGTLPLDYSPLDVSLSFYFNCSFYADAPVVAIGFLESGAKKSYVFKEGEEPEGIDWSDKCDENVVVTVKKTEITRSINATGDLSGAFRAAMNNGFVLDCRPAMECGSCENCGGFCGYNTTKAEYVCLYRDGVCKKKGMCFLDPSLA